MMSRSSASYATASKCYRWRLLFSIAGSIALLPLDAPAQTTAKLYRIGILSLTSPDPRAPNQMAFWEELRQRGYAEGRNLVVERRDAAGQVDLLPVLARELVALRPDLIMAVTPPPIRAAKDATSSIPIVMIGVADPVGLGLAASLAHPGGNLTGVTTVVPGQFLAKSMQLLHEMVPSAKRIAVLVNPRNEMLRLVMQELSKAATQLDVQLQFHAARTTDEIEPALQAAVTKRAQALMIMGDSLFNEPPARLPQLVARIGLPAIYLLRPQVEAGGLMSNGPDFIEQSRRLADYVDRILKGANPGDLAIEQPTKFQLIINRNTAKSLGLAIPQSLLLSAEVIE